MYPDRLLFFCDFATAIEENEQLESLACCLCVRVSECIHVVQVILANPLRTRPLFFIGRFLQFILLIGE